MVTSTWKIPSSRPLHWQIPQRIDQLNFKEKCNQYNLPRAELAALRNLRTDRSDVVIRPADKDGAFVVWEKELYLNEAHRQLSDGRLYQRIPEDATESNQETVKAFITHRVEWPDIITYSWAPKRQNLKTNVVWMAHNKREKALICPQSIDNTRFPDFLKSHLMFWTAGFS